jgi:tetratricopeptide (TPR) repeat protein
LFMKASSNPYTGFILSFFLFLLLSWQGWADTGRCLDVTPDGQFEYATRCFEQGDYAIAVAEFKRFIYFYPHDPRVKTATYKVGMSHFYIRDYAAALERFSSLLNPTDLTETGIAGGFMISACYRELNDYPSAINSLHHLSGLTEDTDIRDRAFYNLALLYLESGDFKNAGVFFNNISQNNHARYRVEAAVARLDQHQELPRKSPVIAGLASILPGGGYLYCERYRDALFAFLINSALIFAACEGFDKGLEGIGGILAAVEAGFYAGNIYGGVSSAHKYNLAEQNAFAVDFIKRFGFDLSAGVGSGGLHFSVNRRF